jgi:hypothetical protein
LRLAARSHAHTGKNDDPDAPQSLHKFTSSATSFSTIPHILAKAQTRARDNFSKDRVADNGRGESQ